jgi:mono/diheme cytochrome c family protein
VLVASGVIEPSAALIDHQAGPRKVEPAPTKEWGEVMIQVCTGCHGPELSGGKLPGAPPEWPESANLTQHETGIKGWTYEDFKRATTEGKRPDGTNIDPFMPWKAYAGMDEVDRQALWEYLKTAKPKPKGNR